jgi:hypothetical protein
MTCESDVQWNDNLSFEKEKPDVATVDNRSPRMSRFTIVSVCIIFLLAIAITVYVSHEASKGYLMRRPSSAVDAFQIPRKSVERCTEESSMVKTYFDHLFNNLRRFVI